MAYTKQKFTKGQVLKAEHLNSIEDAIKKLDSNIYFIDCDVELESDASGMIDISYLQEGNVGDYLLDADKRLWEIISIESGQIVKLSLAESNQITKNADKIRQLEEDIANGQGWTSTQISLFETLLKNVAYQDEATGQNIAKSLIASLRENTSSDDSGSGDNSGDNEGGEDTPTEKTLVSIFATYTGENVVVGTELTDLVSDIVVTATYSDETSQNVTGYELSGEIAEGNNTITVSYEGLTTTFTVIGYVESTDEEWTVVREIGTDNEVGIVDLSTGEIDSNETTWYTSNFIEVPQGATSFSRITSRESDWYLCWYDENKSYIGNGLNGTYSKNTQYGGGYTDEEGVIWNVVPSNAKYCRVSWRTNATYTSLTFKHNLLLNKNVTPTYNKVYYYTTDPTNTDVTILIDDYLNCEGMAYAQIRPILRRGIYFYDENHSQISNIATANNLGNNVVIPSDAKYIKFSTPAKQTFSASGLTYNGYGLIMFSETELTTW